MEHIVFISYSSKDTPIANFVLSLLEKNDIKCWMAPRNIEGGMKYGDLIHDAINSSQILLLIYSENSQASQWVNSELNLAFSANKFIIPYKIDDSLLDKEMRLILNNKHWIYANAKKEEYKQEELVKAVLNIFEIQIIKKL